MAETERSSGVGPTQDGFSSLDQLRDLRTPSMGAIGQASDAVVFPSFKQPEFFDRSQYAPQSGSSYTQLHDDPQEMRSPETNPVQFDVVLTGDNKASVSPGRVRSVNPDSSAPQPIVDWIPTIDGVPLTQDPPPEIGVSAGLFLYCNVKTNNKGVVLETPRIIVGAPNETGTHYQPPQLSPVDGDLSYPIAEFRSEGDGIVVVQLQQGGPILVQPNLWEGRNVGGHREIYKERQNSGDYYEFRTLEQLEGEGGVPVLKEAPEGGEDATIKVRYVTQRPEESGSGGGEAQIKVVPTDDENGIIVKGNGVNIDVGEAFVTRLVASDGLVKSVDAEPFGYTGPVVIVDACGNGQHNFLFRKGLLDSYEFTATSAST